MISKNRQLGLTIKKIREYRNMTQSQLSEATGFSQNTISNHENGKRKVGLNELEKYCEVLSIPSYVVLKINKEFDTSSTSPNELRNFLRIYDYVNYAFSHEEDIRQYSNDRYVETVELIDLIKDKIIEKVSYDYILDLYRQTLSVKHDPFYNNGSQTSDERIDISELTNFHFRYIDLITKVVDDKTTLEDIINETYKLEEESKQIGAKLKLVPNYQYDMIKGEPMYKTYLFKYPERLEEHRKFIKGQ